MAKETTTEGHTIVKGQMEIWQDDDGTVYVGPHEAEKGQFEAFIRETYPDAPIVFQTPALKKDVRAERLAQKKADLRAEIADKSAKIDSLRGHGGSGGMYVLKREREVLEQELAEM